MLVLDSALLVVNNELIELNIYFKK